jgi:hypothetical protein
VPRTIRRALALAALTALGLGALVAAGPVTAPPAGAAPVDLIHVGTADVRYDQFLPGISIDSAFSSPAVGDVTGDGVPEIVTGGMDGCVRVFTLTGATRFGCLWVGPTAVQASPTLVDWNGDGVRDIVATSIGGGIFGWRGTNAGLLFRFGTEGGVFSSAAVADLDRDGRQDVVVGTLGGFVTAFRHDGSHLFHNFVYDTVLSTPAIADLDGDGWREVVVGADMDVGNAANNPPYNLPPGGILWGFEHTGARMPGFPRWLSDQVLWSSPSIVDLDGNGSLDIVIGTGENFPNRGYAVYAVDRFGNALRGWPVITRAMTMGSPAIADLDGDGRLDVAQQSGDGSIAYIARDGFTWKTWCNRSYGPCANLAFDGGPSIGDVNGDGIQDVVATTEADLRVFSGRTGELEAQVGLPRAWVPGSHPTLARYNGDTYIVVTATTDANADNRRNAGDHQTTWIYRTGNGSGSLRWPMFHNNLKRTGTVEDTVPPTVSGSFATLDASRTRLRASWTGQDGQTGIAGFDLDVRQDSLPWARLVRSGGGRGGPGANVNGDSVVFGLPGHTYRARVRARDAAGNLSAWQSLGSVSVSSGAVRSQPFRSAYAVAVNGAVSALSSPPTTGPALPAGLGRGVAAAPGGGGYVLDGFGGRHAFGGAPALGGGPYWRNVDIARGIALDSTGLGGLVLDGYGGLHPFGAMRAPSSLGGYWPGWDIARGVVLTESSTLARPRGYVLDAYGALHPFGGAPRLRITGYWPGWPIVRGFALDPVGPGGYTLDAFGGLHPFGGAPPRSISGYWAGRDVARGIVLIRGGAAGRGYVLDGAGAVWRFGGVPPVQAQTYWGAVIGRSMSVAW